jgi:hypothetical protein
MPAAGSAAVTPALLRLVRVAYISMGGSGQLGLSGGTLLRLLFSRWSWTLRDGSYEL